MRRQNPNRRLLQGTRGQIIRLLRRRCRTANELAKELTITDSAVRVQLSKLGSEGLVRIAGQRSGVRKPEYLYELTPDAELLFPRAYGPLLNQLLGVFGERLSEEELIGALDEVALRLAAQLVPSGRGHTLMEKAAEGADVVKTLGGAAEVERSGSELVIRGWSCPFADVSASHPEICHLVKVLLSEITGLGLEEHCDRVPDSPRCAFQVAAAS